MRNVVLFLISLLFINASLAFPSYYETEVPVPYESVEVKPLFPGGMTEFMKYITKNFRAQEDEEGNIQKGTIYINLIIDREGNLSVIQILRDVGNAGKEIKRILEKAPKWQPGRIKGENVAVEYGFPITIK
jgi:hypothetical protein